MRIRISVSVGLLLVVAVSCLGATNEWNGTWKLNVSKSKIPGPNFTFAKTGDGKYHVDNGTVAYTFGCDGKDYPISPAHTISCELSSTSAMNTIMKENGRVVRKGTWELSADGSHLTLISTEIQGDKSSKEQSTVYVRASGSAGFAGGWTNPNRLQSRPQLILKIRNRSLHLAFPETGQYADLQLDGSDAVMHGPNVPADVTMSMKPNGERELHTTKKLRGVILNEGVLKLSSDGRTLTEEYWSPSRPNEKAILVYERQQATRSRD